LISFRALPDSMLYNFSDVSAGKLEFDNLAVAARHWLQGQVDCFVHRVCELQRGYLSLRTIISLIYEGKVSRAQSVQGVVVHTHVEIRCTGNIKRPDCKRGRVNKSVRMGTDDV